MLKFFVGDKIEGCKCVEIILVFIFIVQSLNRKNYIFKSAVFAIGNSIYHSDQLYLYVEEILPILVNLLNDSLARTRIHAAGNNFFFFYEIISLVVVFY